MWSVSQCGCNRDDSFSRDVIDATNWIDVTDVTDESRLTKPNVFVPLRTRTWLICHFHPDVSFLLSTLLWSSCFMMRIEESYSRFLQSAPPSWKLLIFADGKYLCHPRRNICPICNYKIFVFSSIIQISENRSYSALSLALYEHSLSKRSKKILKRTKWWFLDCRGILWQATWNNLPQHWREGQDLKITSQSRDLRQVENNLSQDKRTIPAQRAPYHSTPWYWCSRSELRRPFLGTFERPFKLMGKQRSGMALTESLLIYCNTGCAIYCKIMRSIFHTEPIELRIPSTKAAGVERLKLVFQRLYDQWS